jgi:hypothetical protein
VSTYFAKLFRSPQTGRIARLMLFTLTSAAAVMHHLSADTANG